MVDTFDATERQRAPRGAARGGRARRQVLAVVVLAAMGLVAACEPNVDNPRWDQVTSRSPLAVGGTVPGASAATRLDVPYGRARGCGPGAVTHVRCGGSQTMDIYDTPDATRGTIVFVHGGGFTGGDKPDGISMGLLLRMQARGWDIVSVNHRLTDLSRGLHPYPTAVLDVDAAIDWIRANGAANGLNSDRIVVAGHSAGGTIATLIGTAWNSGRPELAGVNRPTAYIAIGGVLTDRMPKSKWWLAMWVPFIDAWGPVVSPVNWLDPTDPPGWLIHGDEDPFVEAENSRKLREKADLDGYGDLVNYDLVDRWSDDSPMPAHVRGHEPAGGANVDALGSFLSRL